MNRFCMLLFCYLLVWVAPAYAEWPKLPQPDGTIIKSVGEDMKLNGIPMKIYQVSFKENVKRVLEFYRHHLAQLNTKYPIGDKAVYDGGAILTQNVGEYLITLNIKPVSADVTSGVFSISDLSAARNLEKKSYEFKLPHNATLVSDMESNDPGQIGRHILFYVPGRTMEPVRDQLIASMKSYGYVVEPETIEARPNSQVLYFNGAKQEARLRLTRKSDTILVELITIKTK